MAKTYVVSFLNPEDERVKEELSIPPADKTVYPLEITEENRKFPEHAAKRLRDIIMNLPIRVGSEVIILVSDSDCLEENTCVSFLQRRFQETVNIIISRPSGKFTIPYVTDLRAKKDEGMVDYNYSCGGCSGSCSSCG